MPYENDVSELPNNTSLIPITNVKHISCGNYHTTLLLDTGCAYVYGLGYYNTMEYPYILRTHTVEWNDIRQETNVGTLIPEILIVNNVNPYNYITYDLAVKQFTSNDYSYSYIDASGRVSGWGVVHKGANILRSRFINKDDNTINLGYNSIYKHSDGGGDIQSVLNNHRYSTLIPLKDNTQAIAENQDVVTYGQINHYQNLSETRIPHTIDKLYKTDHSFMALSKDKNVYTWGKKGYGGNTTNTEDLLKNVEIQDVITNKDTYTIITKTKNKITW